MDTGIIEILIQTLINTVWQGILVYYCIDGLLKILQMKNPHLNPRYWIAEFFPFILSLVPESGLGIHRRNINSSTKYAIWVTALFAVIVLSTISALLSDINTVTEETLVNSLSLEQTNEIQSSLSDSGFLHSLKGYVDSAFGSNNKQILSVLPRSWNTILFTIWAAISTTLLLRIVVSYFYLRKIRHTSEIIGSKDDVEKKNPIYVSRLITTPMTIGFIKPSIIIPKNIIEQLSSSELSMVIAHESAHIKRKDTWTNLFQRIVEALLFFNPVIYLFNKKLELEREIACDDRVRATTGKSKEYASLLLNLAKKSNYSKQPLLSSCVIKSPKHIQRRIENIVSNGKTFSSKISPSVVFLAFLFLFFSSFMLFHFGQSLTVIDFNPEISETGTNAPTTNSNNYVFPEFLGNDFTTLSPPINRSFGIDLINSWTGLKIADDNWSKTRAIYRMLNHYKFTPRLNGLNIRQKLPAIAIFKNQ